MPVLPRQYAVTQVIRCASKTLYQRAKDPTISHHEKQSFLSTMWDSCGVEHKESEISLMGYSLRTESFRYTAYLPFNRRVNQVYNLTNHGVLSPVIEELYDHRQDHSISLINRELVNVARSSKYSDKLKEMYEKLVIFLRIRSQRRRK